MSSTNRGAVRDLDDYYATPPELARLICERLAIDYGEILGNTGPMNVLEPGCGAGSFLVGARATWPLADITGVELSPALAQKAQAKGFHVEQRDVLGLDDAGCWYHLIVGNPPFKHADEFILKLVHRLDPQFGRLAFLLRLNFLGGKERYDTLWRLHAPERLYVLPARPGFTPDGKSDSIEYMVAVFARAPAPVTALSFLNNLAVENKWRPGAYEDPRRLWFPAEPAPIATGQQPLGDAA